MTRVKNLRRREIIKAASLGVGASALAGLNVKQVRAADDNDKAQINAPDSIVDILIVGAGNAGMPAAIQAYQMINKIYV